MRSRKRSRGAALLVAMLVAALVAVVATKVGSHYILSFRRGSNMLLSDQGYLFLLSAEALAKNVLSADEDLANDNLGEPWAQQTEPYVIDGGMLTGQIYDLQGRFNINNLAKPAPVVPPSSSSSGQIFSDEQKMFIRLLRTFNEQGGIEISVQQAQDIATAVVDWLDPDSEPTGFNGAEDDYYADLEIPYRTANREMLSASELRLVKGMTAELYQALLPHITALEGSTPVNENTATENVLRSLKPSAAGGGEYEPQTIEEIQPLLDQREEQIQAGIDSALTDNDGNNLLENNQTNGPGPGTGTGTSGAVKTSKSSNYFLFEGFVKFGDLTMPVQTVLNREGGGAVGAAQSQVKVIRRSLGSL